MHRVIVVHGEISTDDIIPGKYKHMHADVAKLADHVFENRFPSLASELRPGDVIWCDELFGIGSSREQAATSLRAAGVECVLAPDFGRIFYRNAWNVGLPAVRCSPPPGLRDRTSLQIHWDSGRLETGGEELTFAPPAPRLMEIRQAGGLLPWLKGREWPPEGRSIQFTAEAWNVRPN